MDETKSAFKSIGIWGGLIALIPALDPVLAAISLVPAGTLTESFNILASAVGGLLAIYGRVRASKKIDKLV